MTLFAPAGPSPGSVSTNLRMPLATTKGPPMIASARAPVPVASVIVTTGASYPAPPSTIVKPVMTPTLGATVPTVAVTVAGL